MAADVTSLVRIMSEYKKDSSGAGDEKGKRDLVTRDFLGCAVIGSKELDLDLKVPSGWERRLDLLSGETYLDKSGPVHREMHDLNLPPPQMPPPPSDNSALDLRLLLPSSANPRFDYRYQSVCTLDKVRSALERVGRESRSKSQQQQRSDGSASQSSSTTSSSFKKRSAGDQEVEERMDGSDSSSSSGLVAAGCPSCLMYVLISKGNPRCPRCDSHVPAPAPMVSKKPRIDLNSF